MALDFLFRPFAREAPPATLAVGARAVPLRLVRNARARRYLLRIGADGAARVTVPRGGSVQEAVKFAQRHEAWIATQLEKHLARASEDKSWKHGTEILFRGERGALAVVDENATTFIRFADQSLRLTDSAADLRPLVEVHLFRLAAHELPPRTIELEQQFLALGITNQRPLRRVTVRNQRSRWGSCSVRGTVSLNWRLVQTPLFVRDYIIFHELAHLRELNHSDRYWRCVEQACPPWRDAEKWLKSHGRILR